MLADLPSKFRRLQPLERFLVRYVGYSLSGWYVTRQAKVPYVPTLLLTTIGQHSGDLRSSPLFYFRDDGTYIIVGSQGGAPRDPAWVGNLRANPQAWVWVHRQRIPVRAEFPSGEERVRIWALVTQAWPAYDTYQERARPREIPVIRLCPVARRGPPAAGG